MEDQQTSHADYNDKEIGSLEQNVESLPTASQDLVAKGIHLKLWTYIVNISRHAWFKNFYTYERNTKGKETIAQYNDLSLLHFVT